MARVPIVYNRHIGHLEMKHGLPVAALVALGGNYSCRYREAARGAMVRNSIINMGESEVREGQGKESQCTPSRTFWHDAHVKRSVTFPRTEET